MKGNQQGVNGPSDRRAPTSWPRMGRVMRRAFREHKVCMREVYAASRRYLETADDTPAVYTVTPGTIPHSFYAVRRNLFSTLFLAVYHMLDIREERRLLYGRINQLFRIWVTSADNLLDTEDKVVLPINMAGTSHVMRQVVAIMAADRVLSDMLNGAVASSVITSAQAGCLTEQSLRILLPSAAQEATEEGGIMERPDPEHVLWTIHRYKTGLLFHIPFLGIDQVETAVDLKQAQRIRDALMQFGLGCQLLDDVRDMARDLKEGRHNYALSTLAHQDPARLNHLQAMGPDVDARLYLHAPGIASATASRAIDMMRDALMTLGRCGLCISTQAADQMAHTMLTVLDLTDVQYV